MSWRHSWPLTIILLHVYLNLYRSQVRLCFANTVLKWYTVMSYDAFLGKPAVLLADIVG